MLLEVFRPTRLLLLLVSFFMHGQKKFLICIWCWHSSEIRGLCLMICSSKTFQNLTHTFGIPNLLSTWFFYVNIDRLGHSLGKKQSYMKNGEKQAGFLYSKGTANFELFPRNIFIKQNTLCVEWLAGCLIQVCVYILNLCRPF